MEPHELDNYADQLNPNNDAYWTSRGYDDRPDDWEDSIDDDDDYNYGDYDCYIPDCDRWD